MTIKLLSKLRVLFYFAWHYWIHWTFHIPVKVCNYWLAQRTPTFKFFIYLREKYITNVFFRKSSLIPLSWALFILQQLEKQVLKPILKSFIDGCKHDGVIDVGGSQSGRKKHMCLSIQLLIIGIELRSQWWEVSALSTAPLGHLLIPSKTEYRDLLV